MPADRLWTALTEPDVLARWLWPVVEWPDDDAPVDAPRRPLTLEDTFVLGDPAHPEGLLRAVVRGYDEGRMIALEWGREGSEPVVFTVDALGPTRSRLRIEQPPTPAVFGLGELRAGADYAAGWHALVDALSLVLLDLEVPRTDQFWTAAKAVYDELPQNRTTTDPV